ncbi:MAG: acyl-CoA dehydrogenase family protein [Leptospiraceae bacterium]|nr:acyl-CoA dehydrogenase family protein [Leptospiraceae bacterium]
MIKNNYFTDNEDLMLHFDTLIDFQEIINEYEQDFRDAKKYEETSDERYAMAPHDEEAAREYYREVLTNVGDIAGNHVAQNAGTMDKIGLKLEDGKVIFPDKMNELWEMFKNAGLMPYMLRRESGGLGLPVIVYNMLQEVLSRADISFLMSTAVLNLAETIEKFASHEVKEKWLPKMANSEYTGAMALTEPNFGSDLSSVNTRATKQADGTYLINGTKRFITHGCGMTGIPAVILTLARTGEPGSGARGLSFFAVDGSKVQTAGIEHKMGLKCSPTCEIVYEDSPADLIGEEGYGLTRYAMGMMNGARLAVGTLGIAVSTATFEESKKYANEREQFGKLIKDIPAVKKMLDRMEREIVAMRCLNMEAARMIDLYLWRMERLAEEGVSDRDIRKDETIKYWDKLATLFTPLNKYYCSEMSNVLTYDGIQIHGGVGYTEEFDVARIYRDARILTIYEGTTQLQIVAAIGGIVAGMTAKGQLRMYLDKLMQEFTPSAISQKLYKILEKAVNSYKEIENKDYFASEVVEITARLVSGLLLEKTTAKVNGEAKTNRARLSNDYNIESLAICQADLIRLESAKRKQPALDMISA